MVLTPQPDAIPQRQSRPQQIIPITSLTPRVAGSICKCLDGGARSCISGNGAIPEDRLLCASRVAMRDHPDEVSNALLQMVRADKIIREVLDQLDSKYSIRFSTKTRERLLKLETTDLKKIVSTLYRLIRGQDLVMIREKLLTDPFYE